MIFAFMPAYGGDERESVLLAQSIRAFGGCFSRSPIWILVPEQTPLSETTLRSLDALTASVFPFTLPEPALVFPYAPKVFAAAQAESRAQGLTDLLVWMDSDTLLLREPGEFILPTGKSFGGCPVQLKNISSLAAQPVDDFWQAIYAACLTPPEQIFLLTTTVDRVEVRAHFNAGLLVVRPEAGLLNAWKSNFACLFADEALEPFYRRNFLYHVFIHQAVLSATLLSRLEPDKIQLFPPTYNFAAFLRKRFEIQCKNPVTYRYDEFSFFGQPGWRELIADETAINWLEKQNLP